MSDTIKVKVDVNLTGIEDRFENLVNDSLVMLSIHNTFAKKCDPYVPFLHGPLSKTVVITSEYIKYIQPYAHYQYNGINFNHTLDHHPLATAKWDEAMMRDHGEEFKEEVRQKLVRRYKELYG